MGLFWFFWARLACFFRIPLHLWARPDEAISVKVRHSPSHLSLQVLLLEAAPALPPTEVKSEASLPSRTGANYVVLETGDSFAWHHQLHVRVSSDVGIYMTRGYMLHFLGNLWTTKWRLRVQRVLFFSSCTMIIQSNWYLECQVPRSSLPPSHDCRMRLTYQDKSEGGKRTFKKFPKRIRQSTGGILFNLENGMIT